MPNPFSNAFIMAARCAFDTLFKTHVPHILEKIFLYYLDYESFKTCIEINSVWKRKLTSESFQKKAKSVFQEEIFEKEKKLRSFSRMGNANEVRRIVSDRWLDINSSSAYGHGPGALHITTPLSEAVEWGHKDVVEILLGAGADPNKLAHYDNIDPLHIASAHGNPDMVQLLLHSGADPNIVNDWENGWTPLHYSINHAAGQDFLILGEGEVIEERYREVIKLLLDNGGDPNIEDDNGETPLSFALKKGDIFVIRMIEEATLGLDA